MRLLVDAHCFDYNTSEGINTYLRGLYGELVKIASDIDFFFAACNVERIKEIFGERSNVSYIRLEAASKVARLLTEIPRVVKIHGIDAAHFQYTSPLVKNCYTIVTLHDILFKDYPHLFPLTYKLSKDMLFRLSAKRADLLLTVSEYSRSRIAYHYHIPKERIFVTPNAVSEDFFDIDKAKAVEFVREQGIGKFLLYVSRIEPRKNQVALLRAYTEQKLAQRGYDLVFIGRKTLPVPEFDDYLRNMSSDARRHVHIFNQVSYEDLKFWYGAASLFVYPAMAEGFGIPPIEAGAAGIPCVCSNQTAMGDFVFFGKNLVDVSDLEQLKQAIEVNISTPMNTDSVRKAIEEKYNWKVIAQNYYQLLQNQVINKNVSHK